MTDEELKQMDKDIERIDNYFAKIEEDGVKDIIKYFDRIHDKLFAYQLFFLAGYISLVAIDKTSISPWWLLIPIGCIVRLIWIDYKMMNRSRTLAKITKISKAERDKLDIDIKAINTSSLEVILESIIMTGFFMYFIICKF